MLMLLSICTLLQTASAEESSQSSKAPADTKQEQKKGTEQGAQKTGKKAPKKKANQAKGQAKTKKTAPKATEKGKTSTKSSGKSSKPKAVASKSKKKNSVADRAVHELSLQAGNLSRRGMYSDSILMDSNSISGLRVGYGVKPWLSLIASWNVGITQDLNSIDSDDEYMIEEVGYPAGNTGSSLSGYLGSQFVHHQLSFGPKFDFTVTPNWHPYVASQVAMIHGKLQFSDNIEDDSSLVNITTSDVGFGGNLTAGVEWRSTKSRQGLQLAGYVEMGGSWLSSLSFVHEENGSEMSVGEVSFGGFVSRLGVGVRF